MILLAMTAASGSGFALTSAAFAPGAPIPSVHTCDGADQSPPLAWSGAPAGTRALALIMHDPDAPVGDWLHWTAWNIPASSKGLPAGVATKDPLPDGTQQGVNDFGKPGYGGPCPPGGTHHYVFVLSALDATLTLPAKASREEVERAIDAHVLAKAELVGTYSRKRR
jgi:Raf kinase inhibitor-like YbhB/YbcL family protein